MHTPSPKDELLTRETPEPRGLFVAKLFAILAAALAVAGVFLPLMASGSGSVSLWSMTVELCKAMNGSLRSFSIFLGFAFAPIFAVFSFFASFFRNRSAFVLSVCGIVSIIAAFLILGDIMGIVPTVAALFSNMRIGLIFYLVGLLINIFCSLGDAK